MHFSKWDLNTPNTSALPSQSSTTIAYGMPTPQMPLSLLDMGQTMETEAYTERGSAAREPEDTFLKFSVVIIPPEIYHLTYYSYLFRVVRLELCFE